MILNLHRMTGQHKAIQIYIVMSIWILLLIAGVYKFWEPRQKVPEPLVNTELFHSLDYDVKTKRIFKICNLPHEIGQGEEGTLDSQDWTLRGVLILIRHGDRGPLQHVRNITSIDCSTRETDIFHSYKTYLHNLTISGKIGWIGPGPFHNFPLLPAHERHCQLGQLTMQGVQQLLTLGHVLRLSYARTWPKLQRLVAGQVHVYSTRYRRTFQSALALLYAMLPVETVTRLTVTESQSMSFCFRDCGCPITEKYSKAVLQAVNNELKSHPAISLLSENTGKSIFAEGAEQSTSKDPQAVRDALLTYICHGSGMPCETPTNCVKRQNIVGIFAYTDWVLHQKWKNIKWKRYCLLKSYGIIRHIVSQMLNMISNTGPYFLLYSGHDHTLEQISTALGLHNDPVLLQYGGRIIFEVYHHTSREVTLTGARGLYFRILRNGKDVTRQTSFCKEYTTIDNKINLCKIEDIVRFIHDDYFTSFNVTNYKDACFVKTL